MKETDFPTKNCRSAKNIAQLKTTRQVLKSNGSATFVVVMYIYRTKKYFVKLYKRHYMFNLLLIVSPDFMSRPFCSHVAMLQDGGKFGRVFCKQTSVGAACRFQNECNKVEIALHVVQFWSEIKLVITNRFCNHEFDFRPNCTPLSAITIINQVRKQQ